MRKHRMFHVGMITDDKFCALTCKAQLLYLKLIAIADDDGFVGNVKMLSPRKNHLNELCSAGLLHLFNSGHVLILHWFCHNSVKNSHKKETMYQDEKALVLLDDQGIYRLKNEEENSGILPPKENKREENKIKENEENKREENEIKENKSKEKEREEKQSQPVTTGACGATLSDTDKEQNFLLFWDAYPKKTAQDRARAAFMATDEDFEKIMEGLEYNKKSNQWVSDNGFFIPDPHNWLRRSGWNDRPPLYVPKPVGRGLAPAGGQVVEGAVPYYDDNNHLGPAELDAIRRALQDDEESDGRTQFAPTAL